MAREGEVGRDASVVDKVEVPEMESWVDGEAGMGMGWSLLWERNLRFRVDLK